MATEPAIAFAAPPAEGTPLVVRVNFGIFAGRAATPAEIDELARRLLPEVGVVSIVAEERHEIGEAVEAVLHQVRIEVDEAQLPTNPERRGSFELRVVEHAESWARDCVADRHAPETDF